MTATSKMATAAISWLRTTKRLRPSRVPRLAASDRRRRRPVRVESGVRSPGVGDRMPVMTVPREAQAARGSVLEVRRRERRAVQGRLVTARGAQPLGRKAAVGTAIARTCAVAQAHPAAQGRGPVAQGAMVIAPTRVALRAVLAVQGHAPTPARDATGIALRHAVARVLRAGPRRDPVLEEAATVMHVAARGRPVAPVPGRPAAAQDAMATALKPAVVRVRRGGQGRGPAAGQGATVIAVKPVVARVHRVVQARGPEAAPGAMGIALKDAAMRVLGAAPAREQVARAGTARAHGAALAPIGPPERAPVAAQVATAIVRAPHAAARVQAVAEPRAAQVVQAAMANVPKVAVAARALALGPVAGQVATATATRRRVPAGARVPVAQGQVGMPTAARRREVAVQAVSIAARVGREARVDAQGLRAAPRAASAGRHQQAVGALEADRADGAAEPAEAGAQADVGGRVGDVECGFGSCARNFSPSYVQRRS